MPSKLRIRTPRLSRRFSSFSTVPAANARSIAAFNSANCASLSTLMTACSKVIVIHTGSEFWSGRRESNPRPTAWKAVTLPLSYSRENQLSAIGCQHSVELRRPDPLRISVGWLSNVCLQPRPLAHQARDATSCRNPGQYENQSISQTAQWREPSKHSNHRQSHNRPEHNIGTAPYLAAM